MLYTHICYENLTHAFVTRFCLSFPSEMFALSTCISFYILGGAEILVGSSFLWESYLTPLLCQFFIPLKQQKWFMAQVPEIVYKPLFNGMQTNLCYVLFLILARAIIYWSWHLAVKVSEVRWKIPVSSHSRKRMWSLLTSFWDLLAPHPRGW